MSQSTDRYFEPEHITKVETYRGWDTDRVARHQGRQRIEAVEEAELNYPAPLKLRAYERQKPDGSLEFGFPAFEARSDRRDTEIETPNLVVEAHDAESRRRVEELAMARERQLVERHRALRERQRQTTEHFERLGSVPILNRRAEVLSHAQEEEPPRRRKSDLLYRGERDRYRNVPSRQLPSRQLPSDRLEGGHDLRPSTEKAGHEIKLTGARSGDEFGRGHQGNADEFFEEFDEVDKLVLQWTQLDSRQLINLKHQALFT
jgi:hypothetical protein